MKKYAFLLSLMIGLWVKAGAMKGDTTGLFIFQGQVFTEDIISETKKAASMVQMIIYQEREMYAVFYTDETGGFRFYLPAGHRYEVGMGGSIYVNQKIAINATAYPEKENAGEITLDVTLFRSVDGYDFSLLNAPFFQITWSKEKRQFIVDAAYTDVRKKELEKIFRKIKKEGKGKP